MAYGKFTGMYLAENFFMHIKLTILIALFLSSCSGRQQHEQVPNPEEAMESKTILSEGYDRRSKNYLEKLYNEIIRTDTSLQNLENWLEEIVKSQGDSLQTFNNYQTKNNEYYRSAANYASDIKDSILKQHVKKMIADSDTFFKQQIKTHADLSTQIQRQNIYLSDLHFALMIYATLPLIQQYQQTNIPDISPMKSYLAEQKSISQKIEKVLEK